jgi:hypothetical protein
MPEGFFQLVPKGVSHFYKWEMNLAAWSESSNSVGVQTPTESPSEASCFSKILLAECSLEIL